MGVVKLRTINECYELLCKEDPDTAITKYCIKQMCKQNQVRTMTIGNKTLVDFDDLMEKINSLESYTR